MNIPYFARYEYCYNKACEFLEKYQINSYPVDPIAIITKEKYGLMKYSELATENKCSIDTVCRCMQSHDGKTILADGIYSIAYNDQQGKPDRIRFTLMHELGHIFLNHLIDFEKTELSRIGNKMTFAEYKVLENEANAFARNVLAPVSMVNQLKDKSAESISYHFGITAGAAKTRLDFLERDNKYYQDSGLVSRMQKIFFSFFYKKKCPVCNYGTIQKNINYCPICGSDKITWGDGDKMKYPLLDTYENGKLKECPVCHNEETYIEGEFCQICGTNLLNKCFNYECPQNPILPSNARFCPICGESSSFFHNDLLKAWNRDYNDPYSEYMNLPDGIDEELPFN